MHTYDVYKDISQRTGGDIYVGVVGPVRTGKSTFIKQFMDLIVIPNISDTHERERIVDELPQSGGGKTIMTTQPKFVPGEAVDITIDEKCKLSVRMVDCVGYLVDGAQGHMENDAPRMVRTPWQDYDIPFEQAAEIGTRKVITDHSSIGIVMTTDGTITELPRDSYVASEERVINELKALNKPFVIILNSAVPGSSEAKEMRDELSEKYGTSVLLMNIMEITKEDIQALLKNILFEFPIKQVNVNVPRWMCALSGDHWLLNSITSNLSEGIVSMEKVRDYGKILECLSGIEYIANMDVSDITLGNGTVNIDVAPDESLFYRVLGEECGYEIEDECHLIKIIKELVKAKKEYDRMESALMSVKSTGYGIVSPIMEDLSLEEPELMEQGNKFGMRLKASAPSLHIIRVDVETEVSPIVGTEKQSEELINYMLAEFENDPTKIWSTDIFGKSLHDVVKEGLNNKLANVPEDARYKIQETLERVVNEGNGGMLCILL